MNLKKQSPIEFTSRQSLPQLIISVLWIGAHAFLIPFLLMKIPQFNALGAGQQNLVWYGISTAALVIINFTFLRRDFDTIVDNIGKVFMEIITCYAIILAFDLIVSGLLSIYASIDGSALNLSNQNNETIVSQSQDNYGMVKACAVFLAPIAEELMFRAGIFGGLRRVNRVLAYVVSMLLFSVYHVWSYAMVDPSYWIYILQYLPVSYILCRCYERSNTIWASILFHMSWNAVTLYVLTSLV